jgi:hypothetical protein
LFNVQKYNEHRIRSIDSILKELDILVEKYDCKFVSFVDASFCGSNGIEARLNELYVKLKAKKYWIQFLFCLRCEQINDQVVELLSKLKEVGLTKVFVGIESFIEDDLKLYNKRSDVQTNIKAINLLNRLENDDNTYKLDVGYGFIFFNPYTTKEQLLINLHSLHFNNMFVTPYIISTRMSLSLLGTAIEKVENDGLLYKKKTELTLNEKMQRRINYKFQSKDVKSIYDILQECVSIIEFKNFNGIEAVRNRYVYFFGKDNALDELDQAYNEWKSLVDENTRELFEYLLTTTDNWQLVREEAILRSQVFHQKLIIAQKRVERKKIVIAIKLERENELVWR